MLYQLSYASAAQTNGIYQKGNENCKGRLCLKARHRPRLVENSATVSLQPPIILLLVNELRSFHTLSTVATSGQESFPDLRLLIWHILVFARARMGESQSCWLAGATNVSAA